MPVMSRDDYAKEFPARRNNTITDKTVLGQAGCENSGVVCTQPLKLRRACMSCACTASVLPLGCHTMPPVTTPTNELCRLSLALRNKALGLHDLVPGNFPASTDCPVLTIIAA